MLWVRKDRQTLVEPTVISWCGYGRSHFQMAFSDVGTESYARYLAIGDTLAFRRQLGDKETKAYMHGLALEAGHLVAEIWGTDVLFLEDKESNNTHRVSTMVNVRLPTTDPELCKTM